MGLLPAVAGDSEVGAALFDRYIAPVRDSEALPVLGTVDCYLSTGMNASETAQRMHLHHNMVRYRLARFEELTGVGLKEPHAALQVWWALRYRDLLEAPGRPDA
nr:helix-turn-helix domain-containing protein [Nocardia transvalensis]